MTNEEIIKLGAKMVLFATLFEGLDPKIQVRLENHKTKSLEEYEKYGEALDEQLRLHEAHIEHTVNATALELLDDLIDSLKAFAAETNETEAH